MWFLADVIGPLSINLVSFSLNTPGPGYSQLIWSRKCMLPGPEIYVLRPQNYKHNQLYRTKAAKVTGLYSHMRLG